MKWYVQRLIDGGLVCLCCDSCQFVVKDSGDYTLQATDPDALVDWDLVEQVVGAFTALPVWG